MTRFLLALLVLSGIGCAHQSGNNQSQTLDTVEPKYLDLLNRKVFAFNESVDKAILIPIAKAYKVVMPDILALGIDNFFENLAEPTTLINVILQGKFENAFNSLGRIVVNTSLGIGGVFDVASDMGINTDDEDMGQTLAVWGIDSGYYIVLPFLGGVTVRSGIGNIADGYTSPLVYYDKNSVRYSLAALDLLNFRANLLGVEEIKGGDYYEFRKQVYLQRRYSKINDGNIAIEEDDLDWLDDEE